MREMRPTVRSVLRDTLEKAFIFKRREPAGRRRVVGCRDSRTTLEGVLSLAEGSMRVRAEQVEAMMEMKEAQCARAEQALKELQTVKVRWWH